MQLRLKELRKARRLTMREVGSHLGKTSQTISRYESGQIPIAGADLPRLAALYGVEIQELWSDPALDRARDERIALIEQLADALGIPLDVRSIEGVQRVRHKGTKRQARVPGGSTPGQA
jgi:transcriptional regulator with XRE-family HTH domain